MSYKRLTPCIFIDGGKAVKWFDDRTLLSRDVVALAKQYSEKGADELIVFDLSNTDEEHEESIELIREINRVISIPMVAGGNIRRTEDVQKLLSAGAKRAMLNFSKPLSIDLIEQVSKRFGKERIAVSLNDFDALFKQQHLIEARCTEIVFMHRLDLNSVINVTDVPCVVVTDTMEQSEILRILKSDSVKGVSGLFISSLNMDFNEFKKICTDAGIRMTSSEDVTESHELKAETSGERRHERPLDAGREQDAIFMKAEQSVEAGYTENRPDADTMIPGTAQDIKNPLQALGPVYGTILERHRNPDLEEIKHEIADILYHVMVLMAECGVTWEDIIEELSDR